MLPRAFENNARIFKIISVSIFVLLAIILWFLSQSALAQRTVPVSAGSEQISADVLTRTDVLLQATAPANAFFAEHREAAAALLIVSSALLDALGIFVIASGIFGQSVRPVAGFVLLFALRQMCQFLTALPIPLGSIWFYPGVPSLFVTYGTANDLFFSGHTALAVYGATEVGRIRRRGAMWIGLAIALFEIATVLVLRMHYTMDIFAGAVTALLIAILSPRIAEPIDRLFRQQPR